MTDVELYDSVVSRLKPIILIVDDTPTNVALLSDALTREYEVRAATSGATALALAKGDDKPDLILLDIMMPDMDGYEVCRRLKEDPVTRNIPIIFITATDDADAQGRAFTLGAVDYIAKPFDVPLVLARVNVHVRLKLKSEMLERLAFLDGLTDIPNRRALEETLAKEWARANRDGKAVSVLMIDVDEFKAYNDACGHGAGDRSLRMLARELRSGLTRPGDFIGRYGGEEFCIILPDCDADGAFLVAERLRKKVEALCIRHPASPCGHLTISIGCATRAVLAGVPSSAAIEAADKGLYLAKSRGRNQTCVG